EFDANPGNFQDIEGNWAEDYINLIAQFGWVEGVGDGQFNPDANMSRAEAAAIVNRMLGRIIDSTDDLLPGRTRWPDKTNMNAWYYLYMQEATHSTTFERLPNGNIRWVEILPHLDWTVLERPDAFPAAITTARDLQREAAAS
ncbi:MAG: S-layer homology domain-containing protein, partial [Oscillospiraceae bacterium]|nr:S-layer homology domain-containing protein [Oscillospiraceae bacterium]